MHDIWGYCTPCRRWYYCPGSWQDVDACPVCEAEPSEVPDRARPARMRLRAAQPLPGTA